jgi:uncharacterized membrane protein
MAALAFVARAFGESSKLEHYAEVIHDIKEGKRDELFVREAELSGKIIEQHTDAIQHSEERIEEIQREFRSKVVTKPDSKAVNQRLKNLGLK